MRNFRVLVKQLFYGNEIQFLRTNFTGYFLILSAARLGLAQLGSWVHFGRECAPKFLCHPTSHPAIRPSKDTRFSGVFPPNF